MIVVMIVVVIKFTTTKRAPYFIVMGMMICRVWLCLL
jgi:hypothetical protein